MIYKRYSIPIKKNRSFYLIAIGDIHYNSDECDKKHFLETLQFGVNKSRAGHTVRFIGFGDYNDSMSTSERKATRDLHDFTLDRFDEWAAAISNSFFSILKPNLGNFLCFLEGHHYMIFQSGKDEYKKFYGATNTKYLCDLLKCDYLGTCGYVVLDFGDGTKFEIVGHHGRGAAQTRSARILRRKRFGEAFPRADAVMVGHDHDLFIESEQGLGVGDKGTFPVTHYYCATGSYLRGYLLGKERGTYVEQGMMKPGQLGSAAFEIHKEGGKLEVSPIIL